MDANQINDIEVHDFDIVINKLVPREVLENVFVTALEGGSNYWYCLDRKTLKIVRSAVPANEDGCLSTAILTAVLDHNIEIPVHDVENEDEILGYISKKTIQDRIQKLSSSKELSWALRLEMDYAGDADSSDVVFQFIVMGEVMFG